MRRRLWVVQPDTLGPYADLPACMTMWCAICGFTGVMGKNVTYLTMQVQQATGRCVSCWLDSSQASRASPPIAGPHHVRIMALADIKTGLSLGKRVQMRRHEYTVVGLTRRMVSSSGDPMLFIPLKDAQEVQFLKDNDALLNERARNAANPAFNRPGVPGLLEAVQTSQTASRMVNAVLVRTLPGYDEQAVASQIRRWKHLQAYTRAQMEEILVARLIATSSKQIFMFLVILSVVSAAIVSFIITP